MRKKFIADFAKYISESKEEYGYYLSKWDEDGDESTVETYVDFDKSVVETDFNKHVKSLEDGEELHFMKVNADKQLVGDDYMFSVVNKGGKLKVETTKGSKTYYRAFKGFGLD